MCGIAGALSPAPIDAGVVVRMREALAHRGPDHAGLWSSDDSRVCLGHRRLAIIDLDPRSNQPMRSHDGRYRITYNGEIYNHRSLRKALEAEGAAFRTESDTEVLLEGYRRWGAGLLDRLSGMFAFAIWDERSRRLFCARDRAGEKPFHYALAGGAFVFASELKGLLEWPGIERQVDYEALVDFLAMGFVADPKSIWRGVRKLAPAHYLEVSLDEAGARLDGPPRRYWSLPFRKRPGSVDGEEIREVLRHAADEMAIADVPLGAFLSGGVDSSAVTAALSLSGHAVRSFTIGFEEAAYDERAWARQVAERYRTEHVERTVDASDVVAVQERLAWHYDEPFNDYSSVPTYYLCREARRSITVALSGDGGDELFAGYRKYQRLVRRDEVSRWVAPGGAAAVAAVARRALPEGSHWRRTLGQYGMPASRMLADMFCVGFPVALLREVARGPLADALRDYDPYRLVDELLAAAPPDEVGLVNAMRHLDLALTLPGDILVKVDRASMAVALEVRPVFLHRDVMELAAGMAPAALASNSAAKIALRDAVRPWLPASLLDRRKQGFAMPLPKWIAGDAEVGGAVRRARSSPALAEILDVGRVEELSRAHELGSADFTAILHSAFVLDQWQRRWNA